MHLPIEKPNLLTFFPDIEREPSRDLFSSLTFPPFLVFLLQEVQVLKALVLGEEERGQSQYQVMCFVTKFQKGDFITADAMAKLRQVRDIYKGSCFLLFPQRA